MWKQFLITFAAILMLTHCGLPSEDSETTTEKYNKLVDEYNALMTSSHSVQVKNESQLQDLTEMDDSIASFSAEMNRLREIIKDYRSFPPINGKNAIDGLKLQLKSVESSYEQAVAKINTLEIGIMDDYAKLLSNSTKVYKHGYLLQGNIQDRINTLNNKARVLVGIASLIKGELEDATTDTNIELLSIAAREANKIGRANPSSNSSSTTPTKTSPPQIKATQRDTEVQSRVTSGHGGFTRRSSDPSKVVALNSVNDIVDYAKSNGFDVEAAKHGFEISSQTGGKVTFAEDVTAIPASISDVISHFKPQLQNNFEALELAFTIDYSGSMSDDISSVINGLIDITKELENVKLAGRSVRVAIVTFGSPGKERVEVDFTSNMIEVQNTLARLLDNFGRENHSTGPGEASFHGIKKAAGELSWKSTNRMMITITDEPSYELAMGLNTVIDEAKRLTAQNGIQNRVYTIVVPN